MRTAIISAIMLLAALPGAQAQREAAGSERHVRMVVLADPFGREHWMATKARGLSKDYTAQDILEMIAELKPDCLERFVTGCPDPREPVPVRKGCRKMTVLEFLEAAMAAGSEKCRIVPKLNLKWLAGRDGGSYFWKAAQALYDLPLSRPIRDINLDVWDAYCNEIHTTPEQRAEMFARLRKIGYRQIGVNMTGLYAVNDPQIDYADFNIDKTTWQVKRQTVDKLREYPNIERLFLYIDYPGAMDAFRLNTPDRQAEIYCENIFPNQAAMGFTFVYAVLQDSWEARTVTTGSDGPWQGRTMYEITKELLNKAPGH